MVVVREVIAKYDIDIDAIEKKIDNAFKLLDKFDDRLNKFITTNASGGSGATTGRQSQTGGYASYPRVIIAGYDPVLYNIDSYVKKVNQSSESTNERLIDSILKGMDEIIMSLTSHPLTVKTDKADESGVINERKFDTRPLVDLRKEIDERRKVAAEHEAKLSETESKVQAEIDRIISVLESQEQGEPLPQEPQMAQPEVATAPPIEQMQETQEPLNSQEMQERLLSELEDGNVGLDEVVDKLEEIIKLDEEITAPAFLDDIVNEMAKQFGDLKTNKEGVQEPTFESFEQMETIVGDLIDEVRSRPAEEPKVATEPKQEVVQEPQTVTTPVPEIVQEQPIEPEEFIGGGEPQQFREDSPEVLRLEQMIDDALENVADTIEVAQDENLGSILEDSLSKTDEIEKTLERLVNLVREQNITDLSLISKSVEETLDIPQKLVEEFLTGKKVAEPIMEARVDFEPLVQQLEELTRSNPQLEKVMDELSNFLAFQLRSIEDLDQKTLEDTQTITGLRQDLTKFTDSFDETIGSTLKPEDIDSLIVSLVDSIKYERRGVLVSETETADSRRIDQLQTEVDNLRFRDEQAFKGPTEETSGAVVSPEDIEGWRNIPQDLTMEALSQIQRPELPEIERSAPRTQVNVEFKPEVNVTVETPLTGEDLTDAILDQIDSMKDEMTRGFNKQLEKANREMSKKNKSLSNRRK